MFYIYVLESNKDEELYIGFTDDFERRLNEHNEGKSVSTKRYKPWRCIYCEICIEKRDAERREKYLKTSQGRRMLRKRLKAYFTSKPLSKANSH